MAQATIVAKVISGEVPATATELNLVLVGEDGETHQGLFDVSFLNAIPDVTVYSPSGYEELRLALRHAIYNDPAVSVVRYPRGAQPAVPQGLQWQDVPFARYGDLTAPVVLVTYGRLFFNLYEAMLELKQQGIPIQLLKLNRIKPIDHLACRAVLNTKHLLFYEEGIRTGGIGEQCGSRLLEEGFHGRYRIFAVEERFIPQCSQDTAFHSIEADRNSIVHTVLGEENR